jgi:hypothetical protein
VDQVEDYPVPLIGHHHVILVILRTVNLKFPMECRVVPKGARVRERGEREERERGRREREVRESEERPC